MTGWPDEVLPYDEIDAVDLKVDAILAHTGPEPPMLHESDMLSNIQELYDPYLLEDIARERAAVDSLILKTGARMWWNGHYHLGKGYTEINLGGVRCMPGGLSDKEFVHGDCHVVNLGIDEVRKLILT